VSRPWAGPVARPVLAAEQLSVVDLVPRQDRPSVRQEGGGAVPPWAALVAMSDLLFQEREAIVGSEELSAIGAVETSCHPCVPLHCRVPQFRGVTQLEECFSVEEGQNC